MEAFLDDMSVPAKFLLAFIGALGILGAGAFLWRRLAGTTRTTGPQGRQRRLAVIYAAGADDPRRLVLVRRDNTEHLLLIGGPTDIVVESNIGKGASAATTSPLRDSPLLPLRDKASLTAESLPHQSVPLGGSGWSATGPAFVEPPHPAREEPVQRPPIPFERHLGSFGEDAGAPPLLPTTPPEPEPVIHPPAVPPSFEPVFQIPPAPERPSAPPPPRTAQSDQSNLAEMARRLESALRRPIRPVEPSSPSAGPRFTSDPPR
jgi:flagellar protein FliO/FliZ